MKAWWEFRVPPRWVFREESMADFEVVGVGVALVFVPEVANHDTNTEN